MRITIILLTLVIFLIGTTAHAQITYTLKVNFEDPTGFSKKLTEGLVTFPPEEQLKIWAEMDINNDKTVTTGELFYFISKPLVELINLGHKKLLSDPKSLEEFDVMMQRDPRFKKAAKNAMRVQQLLQGFLSKKRRQLLKQLKRMIPLPLQPLRQPRIRSF